MHEVNTAATGLNPGRRTPTWAKRSRGAGSGRVIAGAGQMDPGSLPAIFVFTIFAIAALLVSAAIGYGLAHQNDTRLASEQHSALRNAVEFSPFSPSGEINPGLVRVAEHVARVKNLKFERDPDLGDRELRSMTSDRAIPISAIFSVFRSTSSRLTGALSQALGCSSNGGVIIQPIVALGRALGLSVLVEGVETEHQRVLLRLAGCDEMQGFSCSQGRRRPKPSTSSWYKQSRAFGLCRRRTRR